MSIRSKLLALASVTLLGSAAQAAEVRLGLHAEADSLLYNGDGTAMFIPGLDISLIQPVARNLALRGKVSADYHNIPLLRLDVTLMSRGDFYGGLGLGSGLFLSNRVADSISFLTSVHAIVGKNFGPTQVEVYGRFGLLSSLGLNVNYLIPTQNP